MKGPDKEPRLNRETLACRVHLRAVVPACDGAGPGRAITPAAPQAAVRP